MGSAGGVHIVGGFVVLPRRTKPIPIPADPERLWSKIDRSGSGCHPWLACRSAQGYGRLSVGKRSVFAHLIVLAILKGQPRINQIGLHSCDNPPCCNPDHLRWGSYRRNTAEAIRRGQRTRGWDTKIDDETADLIRSLYPSQTQQQLAKRFGVTQPTISNIVSGRSHVRPRTRAGENNPSRKLSQAEAIAILEYRGPLRQVDLGRLYGVSQSAVSRIVRRAAWRTLDRA